MSRKDIERRKKFVLELMGDPIYQPMRFREISSLLRLSKEEKKDLYDVLDELCDEGKVSVDHKGRYEKVKGKWKKKKDDRHYDDRTEEDAADLGTTKKDKKPETKTGIKSGIGRRIAGRIGDGIFGMKEKDIVKKIWKELRQKEFLSDIRKALAL